MPRLLQRVVIIGAGGFAREILDTIETINLVEERFDLLGYIVETRYGSPGTVVNDKPILGDFDWLGENRDTVKVICGVGKPEFRLRLVRIAAQMKCEFVSLIHPSVIMTRRMTVGIGSVVAAGSILSNQVQIGNHVHINPGTIVGHDVQLDDFVSIAPGARISGNIHIEEGCYVGTGANVIERLTLGRWSVIGAGSVIIRDVLPNSTTVGVPGRVVKQRPDGWQLHEI